MGENKGADRVAAETAPDPNQLTVGGGGSMAPKNRTTSPAFQFYPKDFLSSTKVDDMSMTERGVYITLLSRCWMDDGLPLDLTALARMARMKVAQFERLWSNGPLHLCFYEKHGRLQHARLDEERSKQSDYRRRQSDRAAKRWNHSDKTQKRDAVALQETHSQRNAGDASSGNALQSASAIASAVERGADAPVTHKRPQPLVSKRRLDAAWEGPRGLYVPQKLHNQFTELRNGDVAALWMFYGSVAEAYTSGARKLHEPGSDMFKFWSARYEEKWPATATPKPADTGPVYQKVRNL